MKRLLAFLRRVFPGNPPPKPLRRSGGPMADWEFMRGSYRQSESFDPLSAIIEE